MGRSVVRAGAARCPRCSLPPRWCVCDALGPVVTRLAVHLFIHRHERFKPSSTGALVARTVVGVNVQVYQRATRHHPAARFAPAALEPGRELWVLDPAGDPLPEPAAGIPQVMLVDGTWRQAGEMTRSLDGLGRRVRLPAAGTEPGRYWLRDQPGPNQLSSAEALLGVMNRVGETAAADQLRLHLELHVYASLLSRGRRDLAERYLGQSPLRSAAPEVLDRLHAREGGG